MQDELKRLLHDVAAGNTPPDAALAKLVALPFEDLGFAQVDHHRALRQGVTEVIYGAGKTADEVKGIAQALLRQGGDVLVTRATPEMRDAVFEVAPDVVFHARCRALTVERNVKPALGRVALVAAGTSDLAVAEEAAVCAAHWGMAVERVVDVGVAGLHRLLAARARIEACDVVIVVAGMEGALASVIGGLVSLPTIAVPTSVGYGASFGGIAPLLSMLNACSSGITVVNIDNGFGAAAAARRILARRPGSAPG